MAEGLVFDIQHYAVHDGPGIRTLVFLKGCPLRCAWCCNPESQSFEPEITHSSLRCRACLSCVEACPREAVRATDGTPEFDRVQCRRCPMPCAEACPTGALAVAGKRMTAEEVVARVAADRAFYVNSGGGVTFSGGEPLAQPTYLRELLARSKSLGIHTAVETCGYTDPGALRELEPLVDLFFFDLKVMDPARHMELTGAPNGPILENLRALAAKRADSVTVRLPLVPGCTDNAANVEAIAALLVSLGLGRVEVMPYHALGIDKYASLGRACPPPGAAECRPEAAESCVSLLRSRGLDCELGGH